MALYRAQCRLRRSMAVRAEQVGAEVPVGACWFWLHQRLKSMARFCRKVEMEVLV